jgi:hypothetical protein
VAIMKGLADAGQGGRRGHSNMDHWETNDEIKEAARKRRRLQAKDEIDAGLAEIEVLDTADLDKADDEFSQQSN